MTNTYNFLVNKILKEKKIHCLDLAFNSDMQAFIKSKHPELKNNYLILDFSWISDKQLLQQLLLFLISVVNESHMRVRNKYYGYLLIINQMKNLNVPGTYQGFTEFCESVQLSKIKTFYRSFVNFTEKQKPLLERKIWRIKDLHLSEDRLSLSAHRKAILFSDFKNFDTEQLIKQYIKHLFENTGLALTTIEFHKSSCTSFFNDVTKSPLEYQRKDVEKRKSEWMQELNPRHYNDAINVIRHFFDYLIAHNLFDKQIVFLEDTIKGVKKKYIRNSVDDHTILQLFSHLNEFPKDLSLMIIILYCTGMRGSELCTLRRDCLEQTIKGCFVKFYSQKMKKEVFNVIPENLYQLIQNHINNLPIDTQYLFPSAKNKEKPFQRCTFIYLVNRQIEKFNIRTSDGEMYSFKPHAFRHTMGKRMREQNIAFQYIQEQLHHLSPEMTMHYVEYMDREKIKKYQNFIDIKGMSSPLQIPIESNNDMCYAEYMRAYINMQMLPNGICARPVKLGACKHGNSCLTCQEFRTSIEHLTLHKEHLARVEKYIAIAEENNWLPQIETNKKIRESLMNIIQTIEEKEDEE